LNDARIGTDAAIYPAWRKNFLAACFSADAAPGHRGHFHPIDGTPQIMALTIDRQTHLGQVPLVPWPGTMAPELIGKILPKLPAPLADRCMGHHDATGEQELFHIAIAEAETAIQPDPVADDLGWEPVCSSAEYLTPYD
jgi:hypothetical protein